MVEGLHGDFHPFGGPNTTDYSILESMLRSPYLGKLLHRRVLFGEAPKCWELVEGTHTGIHIR